MLDIDVGQVVGDNARRSMLDGKLDREILKLRNFFRDAVYCLVDIDRDSVDSRRYSMTVEIVLGIDRIAVLVRFHRFQAFLRLGSVNGQPDRNIRRLVPLAKPVSDHPESPGILMERFEIFSHRGFVDRNPEIARRH